MNVAEEQGQREKETAKKLVAAMPTLDGIASTRIELSEDFDGDPAMWVVFTLGPDRVVDETWIEQFSRYSTDVSLKIPQSGVERFPYTRIERAA